MSVDKPEMPTEQRPEDKPLDQHEIDRLHHKRHNMMLTIVACLVIASLLFFLYWLLVLRFYVETEDAYVGGNVITVTAHISGTPIAIYTDNTQRVKQDQLLVILDPTDYQLAYDKALVALRLAIRDVKKLKDQTSEQRAEVLLHKTKLAQANYDFSNRQRLVDIRAISGEAFEHQKNSVTLAQASLASAGYRYASLKAMLGTQELERHPFIEKAKQDLIEAYINLQRCFVRAPIDGYVAKRVVEVGSWIKADSPLLAIVPLNNLWVDANLKETELARVRIGQPVTIVSDLYGKEATFHSTVAGISPGTGRLFSLLPPENATGNWIKVVQRIPVRIYLHKEDLEKHPILAGLSTKVIIDVSDTSGPFLIEEPMKEVIATTPIYEIPLVDVESVINNVLTEERLVFSNSKENDQQQMPPKKSNEALNGVNENNREAASCRANASLDGETAAGTADG
jgi:membrane fusion protein (multidrug efflux system)